MVLRGLSVLPLRAQHRARQRPGGSLCLGAGGAAYHPSFSGKKAGGEAGTPVASLPTQGVQAQPLRGPGDKRRRV